MNKKLHFIKLSWRFMFTLRLLHVSLYHIQQNDLFFVIGSREFVSFYFRHEIYALNFYLWSLFCHLLYCLVPHGMLPATVAVIRLLGGSECAQVTD